MASLPLSLFTIKTNHSQTSAGQVLFPPSCYHGDKHLRHHARLGRGCGALTTDDWTQEVHEYQSLTVRDNGGPSGKVKVKKKKASLASRAAFKDDERKVEVRGFFFFKKD